MDDKVNFRYEVTNEGTTWKLNISREMLQQYLDGTPEGERITLEGVFDNDQLGQLALMFAKAARRR